jgi:PAS domain S-box-containing protein
MRRLSFSSLRVRLLLLVLLAVVPALGLILYTASEQRRLAAGEVQEQALRLAWIAATDQGQLTEGARQLLIALAQLPAVRGRDPAACSSLFAALLKQYPHYANLAAVKPDGDTFCSALPLSGPASAADRLYFRRAVETHDFAVGEYQIGRITRKASINFGYPVLDEADRVQAVVVAALDLAWLNQLAAEARLPRGSTFTVIDRQGVILARYPDPEQWIGQLLPEASIVQAILAQREGVREAPDVGGVPRLFTFTPLRGAQGAGDVYVSIGIPRAVAFAEADRILARNLAGLGVVGVLVLVAAWVGADLFILSPVNALIGATKRLGAGELSARTGLPYGQGELGQLARAFDEMAESLARLTRHETLILESAGEGICGLDRHGKATFVNPAAARMTGYAVEELISRPVHDMLHHSRPDGTPYPREACPSYAALTDGTVHRTTDEVFWRKNGTNFPIDYISTPIHEGGEIVGAVVTFNDITERKRAEKLLADYSRTLERQVEERTRELQAKNAELEQALQRLRDMQDQIIMQQKLASLGALTAGIAHEIRNPLNFVNNFAELSAELTQELREDIGKQKNRLDSETLADIESIIYDLEQNVQKINEHGKRADRIVNSMLLHSSGKSGKRELTDINTLLGEYVNLAYHGMRAQDVSFNVSIKTDYDPSIGLIDVVPQDIGRVFLNIINNACYAIHTKRTAMGEGFSPTLSMRTINLGDRVEIRIRDNGNGIPLEVRDKIFHPFFTTKSAGVGTGLGLSISYDIVVQEHKGQLNVETEEGEYTEFTITLPKHVH